MEEVEKLKAELKQMQLERDYEVQRLTGLLHSLKNRTMPHEDVREFQLKFGWYLPSSPMVIVDPELNQARIDLIHEELKELVDAIDAKDLAGQADALVDLVYVALGFANLLGLGPAWQELWDDVQRANWSKERGVGKRGHAHDVVKPPGWVGPRTEQILAKYTGGVDHSTAGHQHALPFERPKFCAVTVDTDKGPVTCGQEVFATTSGDVCSNGHGGGPTFEVPGAE